MAATIFDDFNDGNDTSPQWTRVDPTGALGSWTVVNPSGTDGKYVLSGPATASLRTDYVFGNGEVRGELTNWNPGLATGSIVGLLLRFQAQTLSGYFLGINADGSPTLSLIKLVNGVDVNTGQDGPVLAYDPGKTYIIQALATGLEITCRIFEKGVSGNTLVNEFTWTDANTPNYPTGSTGLLVANNDFPDNLAAANATFDNFLVTDGVVGQPQLFGAAKVDTQISFGLTVEAGRSYAIEYKGSVDDPNWLSLLTVTPAVQQGVRTVTDSLGSPMRIYRARVLPITLP
ncbi:MAG TPA: hypothetical protein DCY13_24790 [Verrucomicrobiales bacterium]|nr:hypothetical protein [Verrucomicrobiales bacterium]